MHLIPRCEGNVVIFLLLISNKLLQDTLKEVSSYLDGISRLTVMDSIDVRYPLFVGTEFSSQGGLCSPLWSMLTTPLPNKDARMHQGR